MASFSRKRKRGYRLQVQLAAESHVPCFQERVGTSIPGYMIPDRLPWRLRARPSATLHEIQVRPTNERQSELVPVMIQTERSGVKRKMRRPWSPAELSSRSEDWSLRQSARPTAVAPSVPFSPILFNVDVILREVKRSR